MSTEQGSAPRSLVSRLSCGVLVVCLLCAVAVLPLVGKHSPCTHDGGLHYYRVAAIRHAVSRGILFTRWLPELAFGYGFPFFNYRAPLSYYLPLGLHLAGLSLPRSLNLVYVLSILGSAVGAYLLGRDLFGPHAGVLAGVAYAYAPYQLIDALVRGNAPEAVALSLMPFVLWSARRLALRGGRRWFVGTVALLAALYLGHNISSLLFTPLLLAYLLVLWLVYREQAHWKLTILALALALGLTAFFWFPALAEKEYVQLYLTGATRNNDFHHNFLSLREILAPPEPFDTSLMNPLLGVMLGLVQVVLACGGLIVGLLRLKNRRHARRSPEPGEATRRADEPAVSLATQERWISILFLAGIAALFVFMSTPASVWIWEHVPLLPFVQFPWRFVGRANLPVALLAGATLLPLAHPRLRGTARGTRPSRLALQLGLPALVALVILAGLPSTYPPRGYCPAEPHPDIRHVHRYEHESGLVGVDPVGAYFPVSVEKRPQGSPLEDEYADEATVSRFDTAALPEEGQTLEADYGPNRARIVVDSPKPFEARYLSFFFPGWRVWVDDVRVDVTPSKPQGLIAFDVPSGRHTIKVRFGETPLRRVSDAISVLAVLVLVVSALLIGRGPVAPSHWRLPSDVGGLTRIGLVVTAVALPLLRVAVVDRMEIPFRHPELSNCGTLPGVEHPVDRSFADGLTLIGYDQSTDRPSGQLPADRNLRVDLYWTVRHRPSQRYQTVVHLAGPNGLRWSPKDSFRPTDFQGFPPTTTWEPGRYAIDSHEVEPLPGTPPGEYDVVLTVFDRDTLKTLSILGKDGQPAAPDLVLGQVRLTAPRSRPELGALSIQHRLDEKLGAVVLLGASVSREEADPGDPVLMTTFWRVEEPTRKDLTSRTELRGPDGTAVAEYALPPAAPWYPTTAWQEGDIWRGQHLLHLPAGLDSGTYTWTLSLSSSRPVPLSRLSVTAPQRTFTVPSTDIEINARLGQVATLVGANVSPEDVDLTPGAVLKVTLLWRAEAETATSFRVFLHLVDSEGKLVAQSDGVPDNWTRPTTGWVSGEVITDARDLTIPEDAEAGSYRVVAGLYGPTADRLTDPDGRSAIHVTTIDVETDD